MEDQVKRYLKSIMRCVLDCVAAAVTPRLLLRQQLDQAVLATERRRNETQPEKHLQSTRTREVRLPTCKSSTCRSSFSAG